MDRRLRDALCFWYLVEARSPIADLNIGIHFYDRRGILVYAVGSMNLGIALPPLAAGDRILCAVTITLAISRANTPCCPRPVA